MKGRRELCVGLAVKADRLGARDQFQFTIEV
jgi:hypothetical protein